jgi:hypothetical protein
MLTRFPWLRRNYALRIAKEGENKEGEQHQDDSRCIPMEQETNAAKHQRRQSKVVAIFDHAFGKHSAVSSRSIRAASTHGHSTTESRAMKSLLGGIGPHAYNTRGNPLHLIFAVELQFLQFDFFQEVFRIQVGRLGDFLKFCIVLPVLLCQTLILGV